MWNTKRIGNYGEAKTLMEFVKLQVPVFISFGDNERCDIIAEFNGKLNKIQCKTSLNAKEDKESFEVFLTNRSTKNGEEVVRTYDKLEVDYFAICNVELDIVLLYPNKGDGKTSVTFRLTPPKNGRKKGTNFVQDYLFENIVNNENDLDIVS